jgi:hypothetical protein
MITPEELIAKGWIPESGGFYKKPHDGQCVEISFSDGEIEDVILSDRRGNFWLRYNPTLDKLESLIALLTGKEQTCEWKVAWRNYYIGGFSKTYDSGCGTRFVGEGEGDLGHSKFCPACGKKVVVKE